MRVVYVLVLVVVAPLGSLMSQIVDWLTVALEAAPSATYQSPSLVTIHISLPHYFARIYRNVILLSPDPCNSRLAVCFKTKILQKFVDPCSIDTSCFV